MTKSALARLGRHRAAAVATTTISSFIGWCLPVTVSTRMILRLANGDCPESRLCWIRSCQPTWPWKRQEMGWTCLPLNRGPALAMPKPPPEPLDEEEAYGELLQTVGARLKEARIAVSLTQAELGAKAGLKRSYLVELESGHANLTIRTLAKMADVLGRSPETFLISSAQSHSTLPAQSQLSPASIEFLVALFKPLAALLASPSPRDTQIIQEILSYPNLVGSPSQIAESEPAPPSMVVPKRGRPSH